MATYQRHLVRLSPIILGPVLGRSSLGRRVSRTPTGLIGVMIVGIFALAAIFAPLVAPYDPDKQNLTNTFAGPSWSYLLGTDYLGRDVLSRLIFGARVSFGVGIIAVGIAVAVGTPVGLAAGYFRGLVDAVLMRLMDALYAFPTLLLAMILVAALGSGMLNVMIAVGITTVPVFARLVRGEALAVRERDYISAARSTGAHPLRIVVRHVLPNTISPVIVQMSLTVAFAILAESGLSFLGVGIQPPTSTWGQMVQQGYRFIFLHPLAPVFPGIAISILVIGFNFLGDGLRDALDPRLNNEHSAQG